MAYKRLKASDAAKRRRLSVSRFEKTEEWRLMKADLDKGLKPNEVLQVMLDDDEKRKYRIRNRRTVARFIKKYLTDHKLPYTFKSFSREGADVFLVQCLPTSKR